MFIVNLACLIVNEMYVTASSFIIVIIIISIVFFTFQINIPHISIIHKDTTIHPTHCVKSEHTCQCAEPYCLLCAERRLVTGCNCGQYHCVMCPQSKLTAKRIPRARDHIHSHYKKAIPFKGMSWSLLHLCHCVYGWRDGGGRGRWVCR